MQDQPDTTDLRAALEALTDALTPDREECTEPAHLARVRAANRAREMVSEVAESVLDDAIVDARKVHPEGATWAELGAALDMTGQAVSKRAGQRGLSRTRMRPPLRTYTRATNHDDVPVPSASPVVADARPPVTHGSATPLSGAAFWQAQRQH